MLGLRLTGVWLATLALVACGEGKPGPRSGLDPRDCARGWQVLYSPPQVVDGLSPLHPKLSWRAGRIYFPGTEGPDESPLLSLPTAGGEPTTVLRHLGTEYWIEDDRVLYVEEGVLYRMPLSGSEPERIPEAIADSHVYADGKELTWARNWTLGGAALYWISSPTLGAPQSSFWRASRDLGDIRVLASLDLAFDDGSLDRLVSIADQLLTTSGASARVWQIPKEGGEARELPRFGAGMAKILAVIDDGTIVWRRESSTAALGRSRLDGRPVEPFPTSVPSNVSVTDVWSDGMGGFYLAATEKAADEAWHVTIWHLDQSGQGARIACDPQIGSSMLGAVAGPDGLYGIIRYSNRYWELVRIVGAGG